MPRKTRIRHSGGGVADSPRQSHAQSIGELADISMLQAISAELIPEHNIEALYEKIVDAAVAIMGSDYASMQMLFPERGSGGELRLLAFRGFNAQAAKFWEWVRADSESTCGAALRTGKRVIAADIANCEFMAGSEDQRTYLQTGIRACQTTPLIGRGGNIVGMLSTHWRNPHQPSERDFRLLDILARQAADLIERTRNEQQLAKQAGLLDLSSDAIIARDLEGRILYWNRGAERLYGWTRDEALGKNIHVFLKTQFPESLQRISEELYRSGRWTGELVHSTRDGRRITVLCRKALDHPAQGNSAVVLETNSDISERKRVEEELRQRSAQYKTLLNQAPLGVYLVDSELRIRQLNPIALPLFGNIPGLIGRDFDEAIHILWSKEYADEVVRIFRHTLETGEPYETREQAGYRIDRNVTEHYEWRVDRIPLPEGGYGVVCYIRDISAQVTARTVMQQQEERLRKTEKMAAAGQLAASLAHEINNPLLSVMNALYLLNHRPGLDGEARNLVTTAESELARVARIVKQSLSYYRDGAVPRELDLSAIVEESLQVFSDRFQREGVQLKKKICPGMCIVGYADEVRQVIDNLLLNAVEAAPNNGRLAITVRPSRNWKDHGQEGVRLTVADNGCGIPKEHLARIFEPFFTTKPEKGTGLGLWVVRGIVAKHDGRISIRSREAERKGGTVVSILWPSSSQSSRTGRARSESAA